MTSRRRSETASRGRGLHLGRVGGSVAVLLVVLSGFAFTVCEAGSTSPLAEEDKPVLERMTRAGDQWFFTYVVVMTSLAVLLLLVLFVLLEIRMNRILQRLDELSDSANKFVKVGLKYFKDRN